MAFKKTSFDGMYVFDPRIYVDDRGYFFESYNQRIFEDQGLKIKFVQDNEAFSFRGTIRGLHYQIDKMAQTKLVRVNRGKVLDVVVDIREASDTYGLHFSIILSGKNKRQLLIPKGFAHGYITLSKKAVFCYKCDQYYSKDHEAGLIWNDPKLNIDWKLPLKNIILSSKDKQLPTFGDHKKFAS